METSPAGISAGRDSRHDSELFVCTKYFLEHSNLGEKVWGLFGSDNFLDFVHPGAGLPLAAGMRAASSEGPACSQDKKNVQEIL